MLVFLLFPPPVFASPPVPGNDLQGQFERIDRMIAVWDTTSAESLLKLTGYQVRTLFDESSPEASEILLRKVKLARMTDDRRADSLLRELEDVNRKCLPSDSPRRVPALLERARLKAKIGNYKEALAPLNKSFALLDTTLYSDSLALAEVHQEIGSALMNLRDLTGAEHHLNEAFRIRRAILGESHYETARSRLYLGILKAQTGRGAEAEGDYENAIRVFRSEFGDRHREYLWVLNARASCLQSQGRLTEALDDYRYIVRVRREDRRPEDLPLAWTFQNLAILHQRMDEFAAAESLYAEAWRIRRAMLGNGPMTARSEAAFGAMMFLRGDYLKARQVLDEALAIFTSHGIRNDPDVGFCLYDLGRFYYWTGDFETAGKYLERSRKIMEKKGQPWSRMDCASALARLRLSEGRLDRAEDLFRSAFEIAEANYGSGSREAGNAQIDLALALNAREKTIEADTAFSIGRRAIEQSAGPEAHALGWAWHERGQELLRRGEFQEAESAFGRSVGILERDLGPSHPQMIRIWLGFAEAWAGMGNPTAAFEWALKANDLEMSHLRDNIATMPEVHALQYREVLDSPSDFLVSLLSSHPDLAPKYAAKVWEAVLNQRSFVLDELIRRRRESPDVKNDPAFRAFAAAKNRAANLFVRGVDGHRGASYETLVKTALRECDDAEKAWASALAARGRPVNGPIELKSLLSELPAGAKLLAYVRYGKGLPIYGRKPARAYGAFIGERSGSATFIRLGDAGVVDGAVRALNVHLSRVSTLLRDNPEKAVAEFQHLGGAVRREIWDPVSGALTGATKVILVPDGELHLVSFPTLPLDTRNFIVDLGIRFCPLTAERDLAQLPGTPGSGLLAMGDPDFDMKPAGESALGPSKSSSSVFTLRGGGDRLREFQGVRWGSLPGTGKEVHMVAGIWGRCFESWGDSTVLTGAAAGEAAFKTRAPGHRVLHLATHGFVLRDGNSENTPEGARWLGVLSGLVFAGANNRGRAVSGTEDGILTAEEVGGIDLSGVDLVILSACNSGQGSPGDAEGVFGLRRSFQVSGARSLVMSLWPVGDQTTRDWMREFYEQMCRHQSVSAASSEACRLTLDRLRGETGAVTHPFYWGSFISVGDFN